MEAAWTFEMYHPTAQHSAGTHNTGEGPPDTPEHRRFRQCNFTTCSLTDTAFSFSTHAHTKSWNLTHTAHTSCTAPPLLHACWVSRIHYHHRYSITFTTRATHSLYHIPKSIHHWEINQRGGMRGEGRQRCTIQRPTLGTLTPRTQSTFTARRNVH